ncbi:MULTISPECIES: GntR family transcriptional regulator [unclassified Mesorhizobium]|jgi:DNA-binding GntR family transcriptional regulator|uniref:GntR family transcriptional regulator n=1 Tax=unclassified Mesorhizobium TaxID=325217 RepID=UPI00112CE302|nr:MULTISPECIES: GntR family transcriptional regulator [unclassified Mesorhizobium]TPJ48747.1 GntR family transcriptional regulator [Mesorhizobium sp. B2-6-6]MBZ9701893.1 GntR family transcriptional regulator [Mesorhizobium sp. CO1-1-3]MBZ9895490.1 GntR family transcriptional regulator [Mesorhizobium sp. BR1-1-6]MBZ9917508.1 GntR family transcriptional regulator [Mesorhizobium sp. BR1-1-7]MBZ9945326.1 GntR family transcriptional regulator [Mesorhizobium sp. BR1-1-11]
MANGGDQTNLREQAYASFTRHLLARDLKPGQFVSQRELVAFTGLPLGAIREIVPRLEAEGLLTTIPQRGMQIAHIDISLIREAFQFRLFMEREAVALFTVSASDDELARLRREHEDMLAQALAQTPTPEMEARAQTIDWAMHDTFIDALGNEIIAKAYLVNSVKIRLIHQERFRIDGRVVPVMREHLSVIEALESRNPQKAVEAISQHIDNARRLALHI